MITLDSCPVCHSKEITEYRVTTDYRLISELIPGVKVNTTIIVRYSVCEDCHLIFQNPRLSDKELDLYYSTGFYRRTINQAPEGMDKGEQNRAKIDAKIIKKQVGKVESHLDIGCGCGYLLKAVGANIKVGIESDTGYVKVGSVAVFKDMSQVPRMPFDLITAIHVLEHVPRPLDFLENMTKYLSKRGHIVIEVPSWKTPGGPFGLAHLHHFETDVLKLMCAKVGLEVIHLEFTPHLLLICKMAVVKE